MFTSPCLQKIHLFYNFRVLDLLHWELQVQVHVLVQVALSLLACGIDSRSAWIPKIEYEWPILLKSQFTAVEIILDTSQQNIWCAHYLQCGSPQGNISSYYIYIGRAVATDTTTLVWASNMFLLLSYIMQ